LYLTTQPGIYLRWNTNVKTGRELSPTVEKICAEYFNMLLEKLSKKRGKGKENIPKFILRNVHYTKQSSRGT
jgi:hypothetical protein